MTAVRTPGGVLTGAAAPRRQRRSKGPSQRRILRSALEDVHAAEQSLRDAADALASFGRYRRAGKLVRLATRVELAAMYLSDEIALPTTKEPK